MGAAPGRESCCWARSGPGPEADARGLPQEEVIEPDLAIIDAHHHLFHPVGPGHGSDSPVGRYLAEELAADVNSGHNVVATVFVQCYEMYRATGPAHLKYVGETEFVQGVAAVGNAGVLGPCRLCAGIVVSADHTADGARAAEVLGAHKVASRNFRGIRFLGGRAEVLPFGDAAFRGVVGLLADHGVTLDFNGPETFPLDFQGVLSNIAELAAAFPRAVIVVDHCGGLVGPRAFSGSGGAAALRTWKELIARLGALPNVYMKLGGCTMPKNGFGLEGRSVPVGSKELSEMLMPYFSHCLDCFGAERCMFESNFPMDKVSVSYRVLWNAFKRIAARRGLAPRDAAAVFGGTAKKVYNLRLDP